MDKDKLPIINKIETITIELVEDGRFRMYFNNMKTSVQLEVLESNLKSAARSLTRGANQLWDMLDRKTMEKDGQE